HRSHELGLAAARRLRADPLGVTPVTAAAARLVPAVKAALLVRPQPERLPVPVALTQDAEVLDPPDSAGALRGPQLALWRQPAAVRTGGGPAHRRLLRRTCWPGQPATHAQPGSRCPGG